MKISWHCLNKLIDLQNITIIEVTEKLTLAGFEIENIINKKQYKDVIIEINITANRQDVKGIIDIAVELSAIFQRPLTINNHLTNINSNIKLKTLYSNAKIRQSSKLYTCILNKLITNNIPINILNYLKASNIITTNSILDIIHFINLKWGQDIHAYKLISNKNKNLYSNDYPFQYPITHHYPEAFKIYTNNKYLIKLDINNINKDSNNYKILLINYEYSNHRNSYILNNYCLHAYEEILHILSQITTNINLPTIVYQHNTKNQKKVNLNFTIKKINAILGPINNNKEKKFINKNKIIKILQNLHFMPQEYDNKLYIAVASNRQNDIQDSIDIVEEVGRIYGFNHFHDNVPKFKQINQNFKITYLNQKIRRILRSMGLHEVINYSIHKKDTTSNLTIVNPLNKDQKVLRSNLIQNLLEAKSYNIKQKNEYFETFEIGTVFIKNLEQQQYKEAFHLSCILNHKTFNQSTWQNKKSELTWLQAKGHIEEMLERINAQVSWSTRTNNQELSQSLKLFTHPTKKIYINHNDTTIGIFSQINQNIQKKININSNIFFFEIDLGELKKTIKLFNHLQYTYLPYSNYPKVTRDLSIKLTSNIPIEKINNLTKQIKNQNDTIIESIELLNEYYNNKDTKTICLRTTYRSKNKTLKNEEVEILDDILKEKINLCIKSKT